MDTGKRIIFFTRYTEDVPLSRYRGYAQARVLEKDGFRCKLYSFYSPGSSRNWYEKGKDANVITSFFAWLKRFVQLLFMGANDVAIIEYPLLPGASYRLQTWLQRKQKAVVTDLVYTSPGDRKRSEDFEGFLSSSKIIITPNEGITKRVLSAAGEVLEIPPCVSLKDYSSAKAAVVPQAEANMFRIGWIGTISTSHHLLLVKDCLHQLNDLYHISLVLIGFDKKLEKELHGLPFTIHSRRADTEISLLKTCDVGILPLPDAASPIEASSFPMIQYMACGLPLVAASNETTIGINHGNDNLFVRTPFEWYACLAAMIQNRAFYKEVGEKNTTIVSDFYSAEKTGKDYLSFIQMITGS